MCVNPEKTYYTLSFIYEVQAKNESVFLAYDQPYNYSENLERFVSSIRNNPSLSDFLQVSTLCKSMGGNDVKLFTITDKIQYSLTYYETLKLYLKKDIRDRH